MTMTGKVEKLVKRLERPHRYCFICRKDMTESFDIKEGNMEQSKKTTKRLTVTFPIKDLERCEAMVKERRSQGIRTTLGSLIRTAVHEYIAGLRQHGE